MTTEKNPENPIRTTSKLFVLPIYLLTRIWWRPEPRLELTTEDPDEGMVAAGSGPHRSAFYRQVWSPSWLQLLLKKIDAFIGHPDVQLACKCSWPGMFFFLIPAWADMLRPTIVLDRPFVSEPWTLNPLWNVPCILVFVTWGIMAKRELGWWKNLWGFNQQKHETRDKAKSLSVTSAGIAAVTVILTLKFGLSGPLLMLTSCSPLLLPLAVFTTAINLSGYVVIGLIIGTRTSQTFWKILRLNVSLSLILPLLSYTGMMHHPLDEITLAALLWAAAASLPILLAAVVTRAILDTLEWLVGINTSPYPGKK